MMSVILASANNDVAYKDNHPSFLFVTIPRPCHCVELSFGNLIWEPGATSIAS